MRPTRLSHVCLSATDLGSIENFYCRVLGCQIIHEFKNDKGERYGLFLLVNNSTFLEFFQVDYVEPASSVFRHLCLEVDDVREWSRQLDRKGYRTEVERGRTDGVLQCWIKDPEGNVIEFHQYDEDCIQYNYMSRPGE